MGVFKENKAAIMFLVVFVALYLILNTFYGLYIEYYLPQADPVTEVVSRQVSNFISIFDNSVTSTAVEGSKNIILRNSKKIVLTVFEGCNGINVMIVFISFIVAFRGPVGLTAWFALGGILLIHVMNLLRVILLYGAGLYFPQHVYFLHKYLLTGFIYAGVFLMWYLWVNQVKRATR